MTTIPKTLTVTDAKRRFLDLVETVAATHDVVALTRNGVPATVMMSMDDYEALLETIDVLSDPKIVEALKKSRRQARQGKLLSDDEVWD